MKSFLALAVLILPTITLATANLPTPKSGEQVCYSRIYSAEHLRANPKQRVKQVDIDLTRSNDGDSDHIYSSIQVKTKKGNIYGNGGLIQSKNGELIITELGQSARAQMDCDGGGYTVTQDPRDPSKVKVEIEFLTLAGQEDCGGSMDITKNSVDSKMILYRVDCSK